MIIDQLFSSTALNNEGLDKARRISELFTNLVDELRMETNHSQSRELSIMYTKLEEASFYAKKALRNYPGNIL